jgi:hypothetical protein
MKLKKFKLKKVGTVLAVLVLCVVSFTAGVDLTQKANSATSASVLPINKGGTGANNASGAATNILGINFANYDGILPLANGGLGVDMTTQESKMSAQKNLNIPRYYEYPFRYGSSGNAYVKIAETYYGNNNENANHSELALMVIGGNTYLKNPDSYYVTITGRSTADRKVFAIQNAYSNPCDVSKVLGYYTIDVDAKVMKVYFYSVLSAPGVGINFLRYGSYVPDFVPEELPTTDKPADAIDFKATCMLTTSAP